MSQAIAPRPRRHKAEEPAEQPRPEAGQRGYWVSKLVEELGRIKVEPRQIPGSDMLAEYPPLFIKWSIRDLYMSLANAGHMAMSFPSLLVLGPPGVGKSTVVREVAREVARELGARFVDISSVEAQRWMYNTIKSCESQQDFDECMRREALEASKGVADKFFVFLDLRLTEVEPQDLLGLPSRRDGVMEYSPPMWAVILSKVPGILFLDEITNVDRPDVIAASYKLFLDRMAGFVRFHPKVLVVAAGNLPRHAPELARVLPLPLVNRSAVVYAGPPSVEEWYEWTKAEIERVFGNEDVPGEALRDHLETLDTVEAVLRLDKTLLSGEATTRRAQDLNENAPTPRSWTHLVLTSPYSKLEALHRLGKEHLFNYVARYVGGEASSMFMVVFETKMRVNPEDVLRNPHTEISRVVETGIDTGNAKRAFEEKAKKLVGVLVVAMSVAKYLVTSEIPASEKVAHASNVTRAILDVLSERIDRSVALTVARAFARYVANYYAMARRAGGKPVAKTLEMNRVVSAIENAISEYGK